MIRQYDICENAGASARSRTPYLIVLQSDLLSGFATAVVAPVRKGEPESRVTRLNPMVTVEGEIHTVAMQEMAAVHRRGLGQVKTNVAGKHTEFVAAINLIFTGV